jgi:hypothetical protein
MSGDPQEPKRERAASSSAGSAGLRSRTQAAIHDLAVYFALVDDDSGGEPPPTWRYLATFVVLMVVAVVVADAVDASWTGTLAIAVAVGTAWGAVVRIAARLRGGQS